MKKETQVRTFVNFAPNRRPNLRLLMPQIQRLIQHLVHKISIKMAHPELCFLFFGIAILYASAGFGGGSGYLAVLALYGLSADLMRPIALVCNLVVVTGGTFIFYKNGLLDLKKCTWFIIASVPAAFLGGKWKLSEHHFMLLLGGSLVVASVALWFQNSFKNDSFDAQKMAEKKPFSTLESLGLGGSIGLLSGLVSIGGGIFLSPVLHLRGWDLPKKIAAAASFFILVNSAAGLAGQLSKHLEIDWSLVIPLAISVFVGGQIGARWSAIRASQTTVRRITALLTLYAGGYLIWQNI